MKTENEIRLMLAAYPDSLPSDEELMIAVFMGLQPLIVNEYHKIVGWYHDNPKNWFSFPEYKTWNSLMPVVDKIESLKIKVYQDAQVKNGTLADFQFKRGRNNSYLCLVSYFEHDGGNHKHSRSYTGRIIAEDGVRLKSVYTAVVDFIRWYNSKNP